MNKIGRYASRCLRVLRCPDCEQTLKQKNENARKLPGKSTVRVRLACRSCGVSIQIDAGKGADFFVG